MQLKVTQILWFDLIIIYLIHIIRTYRLYQFILLYTKLNYVFLKISIMILYTNGYTLQNISKTFLFLLLCNKAQAYFNSSQSPKFLYKLLRVLDIIEYIFFFIQPIKGNMHRTFFKTQNIFIRLISFCFNYINRFKIRQLACFLFFENQYQ